MVVVEFAQEKQLKPANLERNYTNFLRRYNVSRKAPGQVRGTNKLTLEQHRLLTSYAYSIRHDAQQRRGARVLHHHALGLPGQRGVPRGVASVCHRAVRAADEGRHDGVPLQVRERPEVAALAGGHEPGAGVPGGK
jgi:hypothetical protein